MRANAGALGIYGGSLRNSTYAYSFVFQYGITSADAWQLVTVSVLGPTVGVWGNSSAENPYAINVMLMLADDFANGNAAGPTQTNSWMANNYHSTSLQKNFADALGNKLYLSAVQLERGSRFTSYDPRSYSAELSLCQRYLFVYSGESGVTGDGYVRLASGAVDYLDNGTAHFSVSWPSPMRVLPALSVVGLPFVVVNGLASSVITSWSLLAPAHSSGVLGANGSNAFNRTDLLEIGLAPADRTEVSAE